MKCVVCEKPLERWEYPNPDKFTGRRPPALCSVCAQANQVWPVQSEPQKLADG